ERDQLCAHESSQVRRLSLNYNMTHRVPSGIFPFCVPAPAGRWPPMGRRIPANRDGQGGRRTREWRPELETGRSRSRTAMRIAHFIQRYPPALGGSESYFARLSRYLAAGGNEVTVFTTTA